MQHLLVHLLYFHRLKRLTVQEKLGFFSFAKVKDIQMLDSAVGMKCVFQGNCSCRNNLSATEKDSHAKNLYQTANLNANNEKLELHANCF